MALSEQAFRQWLDDYGRAWIDGAPDQIVALFAEGAHYYETPFDPPMVGRDAIERYWTEGAPASTLAAADGAVGSLDGAAAPSLVAGGAGPAVAAAVGVTAPPVPDPVVTDVIEGRIERGKSLSAALRAQAARLAEYREERPALSLHDVAYSLATTRAGFSERLSVPISADGTPAAINAREVPQTVAIEEEPFDSVISDTTRMV